MTHVLPVTMAAVLLAIPLAAQQQGRPWTSDDVVLQESASSWVLRDDGTQALYILRKPDKKKDGSVSTLKIVDLPAGESRALTVGKEGVSSPAFAPGDRAWVTFLSSRDFPEGVDNLKKDERGSQIWVLDMRGGMARPLTKVPFGVGSYRWIDANTIYLTAREPLSARERRLKERKDKTRVVEGRTPFLDSARRLFRFDVDKKKLTRLTANTDPLSRFTPSPDGRYVVATLATSPKNTAENNSPPRVELFDLADVPDGGLVRGVELYGNQRNKPGGFAWRRDGSGFYALVPVSTVDGEDSGAIRVLDDVRVDDGRTQMRRVELDWANGVRGDLTVTDDGFVVSLCRGVRPLYRRYRSVGTGWQHEDLTGEHASRLHAFVASRASDRVLYIHGGASDPDHVACAELQGNELAGPKEILRPNGGFQELFLAKTEVRRWTGALDEQVEGIVYWPKDYQAGKRYPLVLITHGGPHGADRDRFREAWANSPNMYAQRGAFVLKTNYHGSSDYGLGFGESIKGKYYELELIDMFAGIQMLVDEGKVDRDRLGLVGWSNGAILSIAALTHGKEFAPDFDFRFKACAPGAGDVNWLSDYGNCGFGASFDEFYIGGTPWENTAGYIAKSPFFRLDQVETPTIIFFGTEDTAVPTEQGWEHYRAMSRIGKTPVRFLLFPGEPHGLRKISHQRRKLEEELAWFDKHLFDKEPDVELAAKGSPLADAIALRGIARAKTDGRSRYGTLINGHVLVPETVPLAKGKDGVQVEVTRFEITEAQWAAFRGGKGAGSDRPRGGIEPKDAAAYIGWLTATTGDTWRLLTKKEFAKLKAASGPDENSLAWWAGYTPRPGEAEAVQAQLLAAGLDLVLPVGSRRPGFLGKGDERVAVFDVGGNLAEWIQGEDAPVIAGHSAVWMVSDRGGKARVPAAFVGLRLVRSRK